MDKSSSFSPGADELKDIYARRFDAQSDRRREVWDVLSQHYFNRWVKSTDAVLDLGAGYCEFINSVHAKERFALDLNPDTARMAAPGVTVIAQNVSETWNVPAASLDVIFTSNFLEHLDSKATLLHCFREAVRVLRPGGIFLALGPNIRFAYREYWDYFDHILPLSEQSLVEAMETNGLVPELVIPRFLPFTMSRGGPSHPLLVHLYLMLRPVWRIFGRQFFVVSRKKPAPWPA